MQISKTKLYKSLTTPTKGIKRRLYGVIAALAFKHYCFMTSFKISGMFPSTDNKPDLAFRLKTFVNLSRLLYENTMILAIGSTLIDNVDLKKRDYAWLIGYAGKLLTENQKLIKLISADVYATTILEEILNDQNAPIAISNKAKEMYAKHKVDMASIINEHFRPDDVAWAKASTVRAMKFLKEQRKQEQP